MYYRSFGNGCKMLLLVRKSTELKSFCFGIRAKPSASAKSQQTTVAGDDINTERAAVKEEYDVISSAKL